MKRIFIFLLVLMSLILSACGGSAPSATETAATEAVAGEPAATLAPADYPAEVKLTVWTHDQLYLDYFNSRLADWEALHPNSKFTYDFVMDSAAPTNALNAIAAG